MSTLKTVKNITQLDQNQFIQRLKIVKRKIQIGKVTAGIVYQDIGGTLMANVQNVQFLVMVKKELPNKSTEFDSNIPIFFNYQKFKI